MRRTRTHATRRTTSITHSPAVTPISYHLYVSGQFPQALTFDDVLLAPRRSSVRSRRHVDPSTSLTPELRLAAPSLSANMDTVTESRMAVAMAAEGALGVIHRFLPIEQQVAEVARVKQPERFLAREIHTIAPDRPMRHARRIMRRFGVSSLLVITSEQRLMGIVTQRDLLLEDDDTRPVRELMTPAEGLVTAPLGTSLEQAGRLLHEHRIEKLPLVDDSGQLVGLVALHDVLEHVHRPLASRDARGRLRVGAAVGVVGDYLERAHELARAGVDLLVVDVAHGHSDLVIDAVREVKRAAPDLALMAGNVATAEGVRDLAAAGAEVVKVGIGPGAACTTRVVTGFGVPQLSAILQCARAAQDAGVTVVADGGIRTSGDVTKALAAGAHAVMIGSLLAGAEESPGETTVRKGRRFKVYRGMASRAAMRDRLLREQPETAFEELDEELEAATPEGVDAAVPHLGSAGSIVAELLGGLRSGMSYAGAHTLAELRERARFVRITPSGLRESLPHDIDLT